MSSDMDHVSPLSQLPDTSHVKAPPIRAVDAESIIGFLESEAVNCNLIPTTCRF